MRTSHVAVLAAAMMCAASSFHGAHAGNFFQGGLTLTGGWTDNVDAAAKYPAPGGLTREADGVFQIRPTLIYSRLDPQALQHISYTLQGDLYANHSEADSYQNRFQYDGFFNPSKTTTVLFTAQFTQGRLNNFSTLNGSAGNTLTLITPLATSFVQLTLANELAWELSPNWTFSEGATFIAYDPYNPHGQPPSYELTPRVRIDRAWRFVALGLELRTDWIRFAQVNSVVEGDHDQTISSTVIAPRNEQVITTLAARYRHDLTRLVSTELDLGYEYAARTTGTHVDRSEPYALAAFRVSHPYAQFSVSYEHTIQPNLFVAELFVFDRAFGSISVPIAHNFFLTGSSGYQHGQVLDAPTGKVGALVDLWQADGTLTWQPRENLQVFVRYQYYDQIGRRRDPLAQPTIERQLAQLGATFLFPSTAPPTTPKNLANRVDGQDQAQLPPISQPTPKY
jgi:hypothetical protein